MSWNFSTAPQFLSGSQTPYVSPPFAGAPTPGSSIGTPNGSLIGANIGLGSAGFSTSTPLSDTTTFHTSAGIGTGQNPNAGFSGGFKFNL